MHHNPSSFDSEYRCLKCNSQIAWEHSGCDYTIHPCKTCQEAAYDKGWNDCLEHNKIEEEKGGDIH